VSQVRLLTTSLLWSIMVGEGGGERASIVLMLLRPVEKVKGNVMFSYA